MAKRGVRIVCLLSACVFLSTGAAAQTARIGGSVVDETGGVLPGVTVDAASPALIEGSRTTFTDASGLYTIDGLRPGTYTITFTLPGFNTFVREGIELTTGFTANVDVTMGVGAVEETVTVSGASPIIDVQNVQSTRRTSPATRWTRMPTGKHLFGLCRAHGRCDQTDVLGGGQDVGGSVGDTWGHVLVHGSSNTDGDILWDGMSINASVTAGGGTGKIFFMNQAAIQEVVMSTGGMDAETSTGGVGMNAIPREGANAFSYYVNISGTNEHLQNLNWDDGLGQRGMQEEQINGIKDIWGLRRGRRRADRERPPMVLHGPSLVGHRTVRAPQLQQPGAARAVHRVRGRLPARLQQPDRHRVPAARQLAAADLAGPPSATRSR